MNSLFNPMAFATSIPYELDPGPSFNFLSAYSTTTIAPSTRSPTDKIKANNKTAQIPIIALTAHAMAEDKQKALEAGCDEYDTKPIEFEGLLEKINKLIK